MKYLNVDLDGYNIKCFDDYIGLKLSTGSYYEESLLNIIKDKFEGGDIIDVGSNIGNHILFYCKYLNANRVIGFEPAPEIYAVLEENIKKNNLSNVTVFNAGLANENSLGIISSYDERNFGATKIEKNLDGNIKVYSYDSIAETLLNDPTPTFIKIDVEGFESEVLSGMMNTIEKYKPMLLIEIVAENAKYIISTLLNMKYEITYIEGMNFLFEYRPLTERLSTAAFLGEKLIKQTQSAWFYRNNMLELREQIKQSSANCKHLERLAHKMEKKNNELEQNKNELIIKNKELKNSNEKISQKYDTFINSKTGSLAYKMYSSKNIAKILFRFKQKVYSILAILKRLILGIKNKFIPLTRSSSQENRRETSHLRDPKNIKVAMLVDEFTYNSFKYEVTAIIFEPDNWLETFEKEKPEIFFCESAWSGIDPIKRPWKGKIYSSINFKRENRTELLSILQYCNKRGIKTVFWNKEDPTHYNDKIHNFVDTACKFDYIFTTAEECVEGYKELCGHNNVYALPFATQPKLFNPINKFERTEEVIFAGSWYKQHPTRCEEMEFIFDSLIKNNLDLKIYDRHSGTTDENHFFPEKYKHIVYPKLPYTELEKAYKGSKYSLNINTVTDSETMFARRVYELISSGTHVVSNYSKGVDKYFGDYVTFIDISNKFDLNQMQNTELIEKKIYLSLRDVLTNHTYENRIRYIFDKINLKYKKEKQIVAVIIQIKNIEEIDKALSLYNNQTLVDKKLFILLDNNDFDLYSQQLSFEFKLENVEVINKKLIMNYFDLKNLFEDYFVAMMDINNYYEKNYLQDMLMAYKYIDKEAIIKKAETKAEEYRYAKINSLSKCIIPSNHLSIIEIYLKNNQVIDNECFAVKIMEVN